MLPIERRGEADRTRRSQAAVRAAPRSPVCRQSHPSRHTADAARHRRPRARPRPHLADEPAGAHDRKMVAPERLGHPAPPRRRRALGHHREGAAPHLARYRLPHVMGRAFRPAAGATHRRPDHRDLVARTATPDVSPLRRGLSVGRGAADMALAEAVRRRRVCRSSSTSIRRSTQTAVSSASVLMRRTRPQMLPFTRSGPMITAHLRSPRVCRGRRGERHLQPISKLFNRDRKGRVKPTFKCTGNLLFASLPRDYERLKRCR